MENYGERHKGSIIVVKNWWCLNFILSFDVLKTMSIEQTDANDKITFALWCLVVLFSLAGVIIIVVFLCCLSGEYQIHGSSKILLDKTAEVGDFIGGFVGSLWAFAGVILFYLALRLQRKEFQAQKEELRQHKNEFQINRITNVIFKQLEILENKKEKISVADPSTGEVLRGQTLIDKLPFYYADSNLKNNDYSKLNVDQKRWLQELIVLSSDHRVKEYISTLTKYMYLNLSLINHATNQKNGITTEDNLQLRRLVYNNLEDEKIITFLSTIIRIIKLNIEQIETDPKQTVLLKKLEEDKSNIGKMFDAIIKLQVSINS